MFALLYPVSIEGRAWLHLLSTSSTTIPSTIRLCPLCGLSGQWQCLPDAAQCGQWRTCHWNYKRLRTRAPWISHSRGWQYCREVSQLIVASHMKEVVNDRDFFVSAYTEYLSCRCTDISAKTDYLPILIISADSTYICLYIYQQISSISADMPIERHCNR